MQESFDYHLNGHSSSHPVGLDKGTVLANIMKGYEDFTLDTSGKIISSNLEAVNITGYEEHEIIGRHFSIFYTEEDKLKKIPEEDLGKVSTHNKLTFSAWRQKKRSTTFWAQITMASLKDERGFVTGYKMIIKDQTHRLISNQRVKKFRDEYLNLFNNPFIGIFKFRLEDLKFILINNKASLIIARNRELCKFNEIFFDQSDFKKAYQFLEKNKEVKEFEFRVNVPNDEVWVRMDCRMFDSGFAEGIVTDITESKSQIVELKKLNEELDSFIYHSSHDLRSPLTTLLGLINLAEHDDQIDLKEYCNMMRDRVIYLDEILRDLAAISYNNKSEVAVEPIDFKEIVQQQILELKPKHEHVDISFDLSTDGEIFTDKYRVRTVFKNLISNALRHSKPHINPAFVKINIETIKDKAIIRIRDNGRGIRDEQLLHVFGMFYKASNEIKETGLGLYITKLMVDKLQGKIRVSSKIGVGTEFEIELPNLRRLENQTIAKPKFNEPPKINQMPGLQLNKINDLNE